ncbi:hypothetical protein [Streptomyces sp. CBMA156]|uniref:hypothetical protein n=1 Tax=Streptomyces sp. CBMA156 TaxID=1930280 RepID=UPI00166208AA|nr:hypothetical protein [Streptomyces sp. CBMA156]MBD0673373.1 hypothetical protein [Streptomyces sp. CBMA156]
MTAGTHFRQLQRHTRELTDTEQRVSEDLLRDGTIAPENAATATGLADWTLPGAAAGLGPAADALLAMRGEEDR